MRFASTVGDGSSRLRHGASRSLTRTATNHSTWRCFTDLSTREREREQRNGKSPATKTIKHCHRGHWRFLGGAAFQSIANVFILLVTLSIRLATGLLSRCYVGAGRRSTAARWRLGVDGVQRRDVFNAAEHTKRMRRWMVLLNIFVDYSPSFCRT